MRRGNLQETFVGESEDYIFEYFLLFSPFVDMKSLLVLCSFIFAVNCYSQTLRGKVLDTYTKKPLANSFVYLVAVKETKSTLDSAVDTTRYYYFGAHGHKILFRTKVDSLGRFSFKNIPPSTYNICASYTMAEPVFENSYGTRDAYDLKVRISRTTNYFKTFNLMVTCPFDKTKNQEFCPVCKKKDKVLPILFGLPAFSERKNKWQTYFSLSFCRLHGRFLV